MRVMHQNLSLISIIHRLQKKTADNVMMIPATKIPVAPRPRTKASVKEK